jgi:hypothetical protein
MKRQDEIRALKQELEMYPAVPGNQLKRMKLLRRLHQLKYRPRVKVISGGLPSLGKRR